jgi:hypothetical protein
MTDLVSESCGIARWFVVAIVARLGWEVGGWLWMRL